IVPEWYFLPFYAILRAVTFDISIPFTHIIIIEAKLGGVIAMFGAIILLAVLPWLDRHPIRSAVYRPWFRIALILLVVSLCVLGYVGAKPAEQPWVLIGQAAAVYYFAFFLVIVPWLSKHEPVAKLPNSIHEAVLAGGK
ncbi:MAG: cytochrome b, partial [Alphaproteobacteria bacterium]|nr:cytochrome b [Alphaproteobacteria bacterium]